MLIPIWECSLFLKMGVSEWISENLLTRLYCPAGKEIFTGDARSELLDEQARGLLYVTVAKLLHLTKQARLDPMTVIGFFVHMGDKSNQTQLRQKLRRV